MWEPILWVIPWGSGLPSVIAGANFPSLVKRVSSGPWLHIRLAGWHTELHSNEAFRDDEAEFGGQCRQCYGLCCVGECYASSLTGGASAWPA